MLCKCWREGGYPSLVLFRLAHPTYSLVYPKHQRAHQRKTCTTRVKLFLFFLTCAPVYSCTLRCHNCLCDTFARGEERVYKQKHLHASKGREEEGSFSSRPLRPPSLSASLALSLKLSSLSLFNRLLLLSLPSHLSHWTSLKCDDCLYSRLMVVSFAVTFSHSLRLLFTALHVTRDVVCSRCCCFQRST